MTRKLLVILTIGIVGCSGDNEEGGPCEEREGTYTATYDERDGTCGPIPEEVETIDRQPTRPPEPCSGSIRYSEDNCRVVSRVTCPETGTGIPGAMITFDLVAYWNESGSRGESIAEIYLTGGDGETLCRSTYDVVMIRR